MSDDRVRHIFGPFVDQVDPGSESMKAMEKYARVLARYEEAQDALNEALSACNNKGINPPPVSSLRFRLPDERQGVTHEVRFLVDKEELELYIQPSFFSCGRIGGVFLKANREGSLVSGLIDAFSIVLSLALQYGTPLDHIVSKLQGTKFGEGVFAKGNTPIKRCTSVIDYIARYLDLVAKAELAKFEPRTEAEPPSDQ